MKEGWQTKKLGELTTLARGHNPPKNQFVYKPKDGYVRFYQIRDGKTDDYTVYVPDTPQLHKVEPDDILMVAYRHIGKVYRGASGAFNVALCKITNKDRNVLLDDYLFHIIPSDHVRGELLRRSERSLIPSMSVKHLKSIKIPVPPLAEQKRIVTILENVFASITQAIVNSEKNLANARELFESCLNSAFSQKGEGWVKKTLGEVCNFQGGSQPPKSAFSSELKDGYVRLIQIRDYKTDDHVVYVPKEKVRRFCSVDDVMIGRYGPPLFQILRGIDGAYNVALMKADPNEVFISKDYLYYFLQNSNILRYIINASNRAAGQIGLNKATLEPYPISFPSKTIQAEIVLRLEELQKKIELLESIYQKKLTALAELKQSIIKKAFAGELTANSAQQLEN